MTKSAFAAVLFTLINLMLLGQQTEFEKMKAEEERYRQQQEAQQKDYAKEVQTGLDSIAEEYLKYEMEREKEILEFEGKNLDPRLVEKAERAERLHQLNKTFIPNTNPGTLVGELQEEVNLKPYEDDEISQPKEKEKPQKPTTSSQKPKEKEEPKFNDPSPSATESKEEVVLADSVLQLELAANRPIFVPLKEESYRISSPFNKDRMHPVLKKRRPHYGIDLAAVKGTPIYAAAGGIIEIAHFSKSAGNWVMLNHQNGYKTHYFHMTEFAVKAGDTVKPGDLIGYVGSTGYSSGPHLHYEIRKQNTPIDPSSYLIRHF